MLFAARKVWFCSLCYMLIFLLINVLGKKVSESDCLIDTIVLSGFMNDLVTLTDQQKYHCKFNQSTSTYYKLKIFLILSRFLLLYRCAE